VERVGRVGIEASTSDSERERNLKTADEYGGPRRFIRILHLGNTANVPRTLANHQKQLGHSAGVIAVQADAFKGEADEVLSGSGPLGWNIAMQRLRVKWQEIEAIHVHGGIWRSQLYYYRLRARIPKAVWVVHLHGSETRSGKGLHHLRRSEEHTS